MKATGREMQGQGDDKHTIDSDDEVSVPSITDQPLDPLNAQLLSESFWPIKYLYFFIVTCFVWAVRTFNYIRRGFEPLQLGGCVKLETQPYF